MADFGAGERQVVVTATDNAGNVETKAFTIKVHHDSPISLGPGYVNPQSGEFSTSATDVSIPTPGGELLVGRSYGSRRPSASGPLGPQWSLSVGGPESILRGGYETATVTTASGTQLTFTGREKSFASPHGDSTLTLTEEVNAYREPTAYVLKDTADGSATYFTVAPNQSNELLESARKSAPFQPRRRTTFIRRRRGLRAGVRARAGTRRDHPDGPPRACTV